jgi:hypothetical protein
MDIGRSEKIAELAKSIKVLGKDIKKPTVAKYIATAPAKIADQISRLPPPVEGSQFIRILMYLVAGLLIIGLILLAVDQWITPIFQRKPGGAGYIPIPGTDATQVYWLTPASVADITIGLLPQSSSNAPIGSPLLSTSVIEGQTNYSITMDVYIADEFPQSLGSGQSQRVFFMLCNGVANPVLQVSISNTSNTAFVTLFDSNGLQQSVTLDNVPIHKSFRIGIVTTAYALEGYVNGMLVATKQLKTTTKLPATGNKILSPANIIYTPPAISGSTQPSVILSTGIKVLNVRLFGYAAAPSEMRGRMTDLLDSSDFTG